MKHDYPKDAAIVVPEDCSALFTQAAQTIKAGSDGSIRHLAPETPCTRAGRFVHNIIPASALDNREKHRIGTIADDGKISFFAEAYLRSHNDAPKIKWDPAVAAALQNVVNELKPGLAS